MVCKKKERDIAKKVKPENLRLNRKWRVVNHHASCRVFCILVVSTRKERSYYWRFFRQVVFLEHIVHHRIVNRWRCEAVKFNCVLC